MAAAAAAVISLRDPARSLAAVHDEVRCLFLVGTMNPRLGSQNEIHLLEFVEQSGAAARVAVYNYDSEVWNMAPSLSDPSLCLVVAGTANDSGCTTRGALLKVPLDGGGHLQEACHFSAPHEQIKTLVWRPSGDNVAAVSLSDHALRQWSFDTSGAKEKSSVGVPDDLGSMHGIAWSPHKADELTTGRGSSLVGWDLRTNKTTFEVLSAHGGLTRCVDYNPNKLYQLVSGGEDKCLKFWDSRKVDTPVKTLANHLHWVWDVKFNRQFDQLVLSASSDSMVRLFNVISISSSESTAATSRQSDGLVKKYEEHTESVYSVAWSVGDSHTFAFGSLSYDGRIVFNKVPQAEKMSILAH